MNCSLSLKLLAASALVVVFSSTAATAAWADENNGRTAEGERGAQSRTLTFCDAGAQEALTTNTQDTPASTSSSVFVDLPSTSIPGGASGASGDSDAYTLTFFGEISGPAGETFSSGLR